MSAISNLAYVVFKASDLAQWRSFAENILGLQVGDFSADALSLRMDEFAQRIILERGAEDDLSAAGWQFDTAQDLSQFVDSLRSKGVAVSTGDVPTVQSRKVEALFHCEDPNGFRHEFVFGPQYGLISKPFHSPLLCGDGFETGKLGVGHLLTVARDYAASVKFYTEVLGLKISDYIRDAETFPGVTVDATFMHSKTGRHHSLATAFMPSPKRLNHLMIEVKNFNDVGLAYDRVLKAGLPVIFTPGHHPNDHMYSFYVLTPSGFGLEYGWGGVVIDDHDWSVKNFSKLSDWGHKFAMPGAPDA
ncbi:MAG: VOC family protein [Rhodoferax sp.]|nr:VOC family protein [Rhodoferax sp.]